MIETTRGPRAHRRRRRRPAAADLHLLPPRAGARGPGGPDAAPARRPDRRRDRAGVPRARDHDGASGSPAPRRRSRPPRSPTACPRPADLPERARRRAGRGLPGLQRGLPRRLAATCALREDLTAEAIRLGRILRGAAARRARGDRPAGADAAHRVAAYDAGGRRRAGAAARAGPRQLGPRADRRGPRAGARVPGDRPARPLPAAGRDQRRAHRRAAPPPTPTGRRSPRSTASCAAIDPSPVVALNRAVAVAELDGPEVRAGAWSTGCRSRATTPGTPPAPTCCAASAAPPRPARRTTRRIAAAAERNPAERGLPHAAPRPAAVRGLTASACVYGGPRDARLTPRPCSSLPADAERRGVGPLPRRDGIAAARDLVDGLRGEPPTEAMAALRQWDEVSLQLGNVAAIGSLLGNVHPDEGVRTAAEEAEQDVMRAAHRAQPRPRALRGLRRLSTPTGLDEQAARLLDKVLRDFTRAGVDQDDATRARIAAINERLTELDQEFSKAIRDDVRTIRVTPERLAGLPQDFLDAHPADDEGLVTVTTDYPDAVPTRMFAHDAEVRRDMTVAFLQRGWPDDRPAAPGDVRPAPRAGQPGRLPRLGGLRRRREDDQGGPGDRGVHRQDRRRRGRADGARPGGPARALRARTSPTPTRDPRLRTRPTTRSSCARSSTRSTPSGCAPTSPSTRCARACSR